MVVYTTISNFNVDERNSTNLTYQVLAKARVNVH